MGEVYPTNKSAILLAADGKLVPEVESWGFPSFKGSGMIINARSETAHEKRMFKNGMESRRCIVPCTGFYEWALSKEKYLFTDPDSSCTYMAGICGDFDGERRYVILTTDANESVKGIHHRMPVIVRKKQIIDWLTDLSHAEQIMNSSMPQFNKIAV